MSLGLFTKGLNKREERPKNNTEKIMNLPPNVASLPCAFAPPLVALLSAC